MSSPRWLKRNTRFPVLGLIFSAFAQAADPPDAGDVAGARQEAGIVRAGRLQAASHVADGLTVDDKKERVADSRTGGGSGSTGFNFDALEFLSEFEAEAVSFSTRQLAHPPELTFEGNFCGKYVFLHVCLEPPEDAEATEVIDVSGDGGPVVRDKSDDQGRG